MISSEPHSPEVEVLLESFYQQADRLFERHLLTLWKKREQTLYIDDYGVVAGIETWHQELRYFRDNVMLRDSDFSTIVKTLIDYGAEAECCHFSPTYQERVFAGFADWIEDNIRDSVKLVEVDEEQPQIPTGHVVTGPEYEAQCARVLEQNGWLVTRKGRSGDQGVDLVGSLGDLRVAIQCKRYTQPVGNKAVQEVS